MIPVRTPSAKTLTLLGLGTLVVGFFIGAHLPGLEWFGFLVALLGTLATLYGVLTLIYRHGPE
jgi:hypothetical protein